MSILQNTRNSANVVDQSILRNLSGIEDVEHSIDLDEDSERLAAEYVAEKGLNGESPEHLENAVNAVRTDFDHVTALARNNSQDNMSQKELERKIDSERKEMQRQHSEEIKFSNVLSGAYDGSESDILEHSQNGYLAGGCIERTIMMSYVLEELGYETELKMGSAEIPTEDGATFAGHAWTELDYHGKTYVADPSISTKFDLEEKTREVSDHYIEKNF